MGKWVEAASYALAHRRDAVIEAQIEAIIDDLEAAQAPDGYLNCWYQDREPQNRWTNLRDNHELYNAGHLLEGAVAYAQATGRERFLRVTERYVDHIAATFGPTLKRCYCGHPEVELALVKLYRLNGNRTALDLAAYFVNERGAVPHYFDVEARARGEDPANFGQKTHEYSQSHLPVRQQTKVVGHAVRAMYWYAAMADLAVELEDASLKTACAVFWDDLLLTKMYVTGGLGPSASNEGFTRDYDLPNATAYAETCAAVALIFWAQKMLHFDLDGRYADILETALYNGALVGLSRDGTSYFYANPLESDGTATRWHWHDCPCCTMNVSRLVASVAGYFMSVGPDALVFHLYGGSSAAVTVAGTKVQVNEVSDYPWSGDITISIDPAEPVEFALKLRVPGWALGVTVAINGTKIDAAPTRGYVTLHRLWHPGDTVDLVLPMPAERIFAHPAVTMNAGRVALRRGPLIYCLEETDHGCKVQDLRLPRDAPLSPHPSPLFGGIIIVMAQGLTYPTDPGIPYTTQAPVLNPVTLSAIKYFLWNNRGQGSMMVRTPEI